jgi:hypothetical protein
VNRTEPEPTEEIIHINPGPYHFNRSFPRGGSGDRFLCSCIIYRAVEGFTKD